MTTIFIYIDNKDSKRKCLSYIQDIKMLEIIGIVVKKYEDTNDHLRAKIDVSYKNQVSTLDFFSSDESGIYDYCVKRLLFIAL